MLGDHEMWRIRPTDMLVTRLVVAFAPIITPRIRITVQKAHRNGLGGNFMVILLYGPLGRL